MRKIFYFFIFLTLHMHAQSVADVIERNRNFSAGNYGIYPDSNLTALTPAPAGKHPFYISHYGRHGSRYISNFRDYELPYNMLLHADSLGKLTPTGREALNTMRGIYADSKDRWGDLSEIGKKQQRNIAHRMMQNFPEVFRGRAFVDARSTIVTRCVLSMGTAVLQMVTENPKLKVSMSNSFKDMWYMNHQNRHLRDSMMTPRAQAAYDAFEAKRSANPRLMGLLFNDTAYVRQYVDEVSLNYRLLKTAFIQQNVNAHGGKNTLQDLFTYEDIIQFWERENAWWYINYGPSLLNGGKQPYTQCNLLRRIIEEADSIIAGKQHGVSLRFGHETVVLPLACLLGINGNDYQTDNLEELEAKGWWACLVAPMASNIQFVFYRKNAKDKDVLFKVLLNEREATLPISTDIAPYYHWRDFRAFYRKKIDDYERSVAQY